MTSTRRRGTGWTIVQTGPVPDDPAAPDPLLDAPSWAPSWLPTVDDLRGTRMLRWMVGIVFFAGLAACVSRGADSPADPVLGPRPSSTLAPSGGTSSGADAPSGAGDTATELAAIFGTVLGELVSASGELLELCLLRADTAEERSRGLMGVTDLRGHDGMVFVNDTTVASSFYMFDTQLPLTVAWWDETGAFVSATDMDPCESEDPAACPRHPPAGPYRLALEVEQGSSVARAFAPGASLRLTGDACRARS